MSKPQTLRRDRAAMPWVPLQRAHTWGKSRRATSSKPKLVLHPNILREVISTTVPHDSALQSVDTTLTYCQNGTSTSGSFTRSIVCCHDAWFGASADVVGAAGAAATSSSTLDMASREQEVKARTTAGQRFDADTHTIGRRRATRRERRERGRAKMYISWCAVCASFARKISDAGQHFDDLMNIRCLL